MHVMRSHAHNDHIGDLRPNNGEGTCGTPATGAANPNTNFASIAALKNAAVLAPGELSTYLSRKIQNVRGSTPAGVDGQAIVIFWSDHSPCRSEALVAH